MGRNIPSSNGTRWTSCAHALAILALIVAAVSYLLGSIPFGYLLVRIFRGQDVRQTGSGNIGATNVARTGSKGLAIATLALDALKGYAAVAAALWIAGPGVTRLPESWHVAFSGEQQYRVAALSALCAIVGHMFTVWLGFKGGKGVATAVGAFAAFAPRAVLVCLALFIVIVLLTRYVSVGSMISAAVFPLAAWWFNPSRMTTGVLFLIGACSLLIIVRHKDNIWRLVAGTENKLR